MLNVAKSKMGTPYIWGHNEDRGQYGFDCSNFTSYVHRHALGYKMTTSSRAQFNDVGWNVSRTSMQPGALIIFDDGHHAGIYAGNDQVIQEGGGLGKVGYLSLNPAHIGLTTCRRSAECSNMIISQGGVPKGSYQITQSQHHIEKPQNPQ
ncbi:hypothetical protein GCM10025859_23760 [Alicyclobacillus fastidiosus]|nr:hypothetical protein GCM10025859_23760 [Alicyclobacillus fastidiosus]